VGLVNAQSKSVSGKVLSAEDGQPVIGASVMVKGTTSGTITGVDGGFTVVLAGNAKTLVISYVGMKTIEVEAKSGMNVNLESDSQIIDEVVVVGYGSAKKLGTVVGSIARVGTEKLKEKPVANVLDAMQGKVAGLQVYTSSGEPSSLSSIRLHGNGSLGASSAPLYVLDGTPMVTGAALSINSYDIESLTVLKDASATSIYGSRAANGVIYITTKKGSRTGKSKITVNTQYGTSNLINPGYYDSFMNTKQLTDFWVATAYRTQAQVDALLLANPNDFNWEEFYYKKDAPTYQGDVSISGGNEKTTYFISGSYLNQDGLAYRSGFERYTMRSNVDTKVNDWMSAGVNLSGAFDKRMSNPYGTNSTNRGLAMLAQPFYSPYDATGVEYPDLIPGWNRYNPKYLADKNPYNEGTVQANAIGYIQITPFKGLTLKSQAALDAYGKSINVTRLPSNKTSLNNGLVEEYFDYSFNKSITNTAEYQFELFNDHRITALAGQEFVDYNYKQIYASTSKQTDDRLILLSNGTDNKNATSAKAEYAFLSYFGRIDYSYKNKYFVDFSLRQDASSRFGKNNQKATFFAAGAMWDAKKESFLSEVEFLSSLRLKASAGSSGNADIGNYLHLAQVGTSTYDGGTGWGINWPGNKDLQWEKQFKTTIGLKFGLFDEKIRTNIEVYDRNTSNMLMDVPYPYTSGYGMINSNVGTLNNKGIDFSLEFDVLKGKDYFVTPYINVNYNKEKVTELFQGRNYWIIPNTGVSYVVGQPVQYFYPIFAGVDATDGMPTWYLPGADNTVTSKETTSKAAFNSANLQQNTGINRYAPFNGGFGLNAGWKGVSLQVDFAFSQGKYLINNDRYFFENPSQFGGFNQQTTILDYWKAAGDVTKFPKYGQQFTQFDSRLIEDASFMRLKNISLGYSLPSNLLKATKFFTSARFFVSARNMLTWTKYSGLDPEVDSNLTLGVNPNTKQLSAGCEISF
jgi:TonB-linked SusC/RagA family outer membrane protein